MRYLKVCGMLFGLMSMAIVIGASGVVAEVSGSDADSDESCYIELFDGEDFEGDHITIRGEGEYPNLDELPGADGKNWTDEADSFKVGPGATVTVWTEKNFKGKSKTYQSGEYASVDEPYSLKIVCNNKR